MSRRRRLARWNRRLRDRLTGYRKRYYAAAAVALLLSFGFAGYVATDEDPGPVPLGDGRAGLLVADMSMGLEDARDTLRRERAPDVPESTPDPEGGGEPIGGGEASYYGDELAGRPTASGERFDPGGLTAAHRTLPLGSRVRVTSVATGQSVVVRINDRGPFHGNRVIDLSVAAARRIGLLSQGKGRVEMMLLTR